MHNTITHPQDKSGRYICDYDHPMPATHDGQWIHPHAKEIHSASDYYERFKCPCCRQEFSVELPE